MLCARSREITLLLKEFKLNLRAQSLCTNSCKTAYRYSSLHFKETVKTAVKPMVFVLCNTSAAEIQSVLDWAGHITTGGGVWSNSGQVERTSKLNTSLAFTYTNRCRRLTSSPPFFACWHASWCLPMRQHLNWPSVSSIKPHARRRLSLRRTWLPPGSARS